MAKAEIIMGEARETLDNRKNTLLQSKYVVVPQQQNTTITMENLEQILAVEYWYQDSMYGYATVDKDGHMYTEHDNYNHNYGGIQSISGNSFVFRWNNAGFTFVAVGTEPNTP